MKNDQQEKMGRRFAGYVRDLAEWIGAQVKRDEQAYFTLGSDHVRQIQKFEVEGSTARALAEKIVRRASSYRTRRRAAASRFYVSARANGLTDQVELNFAEERIRSMPRARSREGAGLSGSPETDALGQWLQKCFRESSVTQIALGCRSAVDAPLCPVASWGAEDFEAYASTPEWFAPIVMEAANTVAGSQQATIRYVVRLHRDGEETHYAKYSFRLAGGASGLDGPEADGTRANNNLNVQRFVLDMYERHQQTVMAAHLELLVDLRKLTEMVFAESRSAT